MLSPPESLHLLIARPPLPIESNDSKSMTNQLLSARGQEVSYNSACLELHGTKVDQLRAPSARVVEVVDLIKDLCTSFVAYAVDLASREFGLERRSGVLRLGFKVEHAFGFVSTLDLVVRERLG